MSPKIETLPNAGTAFLDIGKLRNYCLDPSHPEGRHKARVFARVLEIGKGEAAWLRDEILRKIATAPIVSAVQTEFGWRYTVDVEIERNGRHALIRTGWIVRTGESIPRMTTCFVI